MFLWGYWDWNERMDGIESNGRLIEREREREEGKKKNP
jgi:hypothetical protein